MRYQTTMALIALAMAFSTTMAKASVAGRTYTGNADCGYARDWPTKLNTVSTNKLCQVTIQFNFGNQVEYSVRDFDYVRKHVGTYSQQGDTVYFQFGAPSSGGYIYGTEYSNGLQLAWFDLYLN